MDTGDLILPRSNEEIVARGCGWNPFQATIDCDWDRNCPVHGDRSTITTEYALRLRDGTILTFDTRDDRDARAVEYEGAEWTVALLTRQVRPAEYGEWVTDAPA